MLSSPVCYVACSLARKRYQYLELQRNNKRFNAQDEGGDDLGAKLIDREVDELFDREEMLTKVLPATSGPVERSSNLDGWRREDETHNLPPPPVQVEVPPAASEQQPPPPPKKKIEPTLPPAQLEDWLIRKKAPQESAPPPKKKIELSPIAASGPPQQHRHRATATVGPPQLEDWMVRKKDVILKVKPAFEL